MTIYIESLDIDKSENLLNQTTINFHCDALISSQNSLHLYHIFTGCLMKFFLAFSVYSNGKKILSTRKTAGTLGAVNGVRVLSISWVILGHIFAFIIGVVCKSTWWWFLRKYKYGNMLMLWIIINVYKW